MCGNATYSFMPFCLYLACYVQVLAVVSKWG